ncbi:acylphosphatase [Marinimicrobium agarilyticum]|uniref:acylphosphatase n=1 Tax=Marinimicrobium agarilyticum TaxID=306546 RepID=UPI000413B447|nr:acylphosphatase [Marinimicrobium agarilyticum]
MTHARHFVISGVVQGVSYRANAQQKAQALGLAGWVRNLPDGRVEALAQGDIDALDAFEGWLWEGPKHASVTQVDIKPAAPQANTDFEVRG